MKKQERIKKELKRNKLELKKIYYILKYNSFICYLTINVINYFNKYLFQIINIIYKKLFFYFIFIINLFFIKLYIYFLKLK